MVKYVTRPRFKKLTYEARLDIVEWDKRRRALGKQKDKARQHNISVSRLEQIIYRARAKEEQEKLLAAVQRRHDVPEIRCECSHTEAEHKKTLMAPCTARHCDCDAFLEALPSYASLAPPSDKSIDMTCTECFTDPCKPDCLGGR